MNHDRLIKTLSRHEGRKLKSYQDTVGKTTIGVGRNIEDNGLSEDEINYLLVNDINRCEIELRTNFGFFDDLSSPRQEVLLNMCFNLGLTRLMGFKRMLVALAQEDYRVAAAEMLDSRWATQVGDRAMELSGTMRRGRWYD